MIDFTSVGKNGVIFQYEDIISLSGFNVLNRFREKGIDQVKDKSEVDLVMSYFNRDQYSVADWVQQESSLPIQEYMNSPVMWKPSLLYAYKIIDTAYKSGVKTIMIHSNQYVKSIEDNMKTFTQPVTYIHGDIVPVLKQHPNITYITSLPDNIRKCADSGVPFVLTIVDDFGYVHKIIQDKVDEELRKKNILVFFTSIISGGFIDTFEE